MSAAQGEDDNRRRYSVGGAGLAYGYRLWDHLEGRWLTEPTLMGGGAYITRTDAMRAQRMMDERLPEGVESKQRPESTMYEVTPGWWT